MLEKICQRVVTVVKAVIVIGLRNVVVDVVCFFQAGQATEPECLVAVGLAAGDDGQVDTCLVVDAENS